MADSPSERSRRPEDTDTRTLEPPRPEEHRRDKPYLIVLAGSAMGVMHRIDGAVTIIGRSEKADLRIVDDGISREHARVFRRGDDLVLEDLQSTNGTFRNGARVQAAQVLGEGDKILIGSGTILKFTYHDQIDEIFQKQLTESALRDALTKVYNKKFFIDRLQSEFTFAERHRAPVTLLFLDIDRFKTVNDTHGHTVGDYVLAEVAALMGRSLRAEDILARYGGEEFAVICRGMDLTRGLALAQRLRQAVAGHRFEQDGTTMTITISGGVARAPDPKLRSAADLVAAADAAMYEAKRAGRNRVCVHPPTEDSEITPKAREESREG